MTETELKACLARDLRRTDLMASEAVRLTDYLIADLENKLRDAKALQARLGRESEFEVPSMRMRQMSSTLIELVGLVNSSTNTSPVIRSAAKLASQGVSEELSKLAD